MKLHICHLYPDLLDLYGDRGNILTIEARCRWRGIESAVQKVSLGETLDFDNIDILFIGGGSDREQSLLVKDLQRREKELRNAIDNGLVVLAICGGYQLLGRYYQTAGGEKIPGLGILDLWTIAGSKRLIGNVALELGDNLFSQTEALNNSLSHKDSFTVVGFENHSGKTFLGSDSHPLGRVLSGHGNNAQDGTEGVHYQNVFGTYLHGPLLPKNPQLADLLIELALKRRGYAGPLQPLDDKLEELAHQSMLKRIMGNS